MTKAIPLLLPLVTITLFAQEPNTHTVKFPSGDAAWTVKIEQLEPVAPLADGTSMRQLKSVEILRKGNVRRDQALFNDDTTSQYWWSLSPAVVLFRAKPTEPIFPLRPGQLGSLSYDAANFSWVNSKTFKKEKTVGGKLLREYGLKVENEGIKTIYSASIDAKTGLPVTWSDGKVEATFAFKDPQTEPLTMPSEYRAELERILPSLAPVKPLGKR